MLTDPRGINQKTKKWQMSFFPFFLLRTCTAVSSKINMALSSVLSLKHIFGLKGDVKNNIHYYDESHVIYPAGHNIVVYNFEAKSQNKIQSLSDQYEFINISRK